MDKDEYTRGKMQDIARCVEEQLPKGFGFFVLVFEFGTDQRGNYISNAERQDVINVMKEFLIRCGAEEDWMKDL